MTAPAVGLLLARAVALLRVEDGRVPVRFGIQLVGVDFQCVARLAWRLHEAGPRLVVVDAITGSLQCESLPGRACDIDHHDEGGADQPAMPADLATLTPAPAFPSFMAHLVDRAASRLQAEDWRQSVAFTWWADGQDVPYTARIDWAPTELDPRVIVFDGRSGEFVCQSQPGKLHDIDPATWCLDVPPDEVDRDAWNKANKP